MCHYRKLGSASDMTNSPSDQIPRVSRICTNPVSDNEWWVDHAFLRGGRPHCRPKCSIRISSANFLIVFHSIYGYVLLSFQDVAMEQTTDRWPTCTNIRNQCKSGTNQHQHHLQNYSDVGLFTFSFPAHRMESIPRCCALHGHSHRATREPLHACLMHHTSLCCCHCSHHLWLESSPCQLQLCAALYLLQRPGFNHRSC